MRHCGIRNTSPVPGAAPPLPRQNRRSGVAALGRGAASRGRAVVGRGAASLVGVAVGLEGVPGSGASLEVVMSS